ncbi:MAG: DNA cytosine methyltransferase [Proteobacteria bacterium]|nr:MAG: DNA cytosine methyltransferase [Pseudomonadota bacterium]
MRHTGFRNRLLSWAGSLGYDFADIVILDAKNLGIVQDRKRSVFLGIKTNAEGYVQSLVLAKPFSRTVGETIADVAFPYLREIEGVSESVRTVGQRKYLKWAKDWLDTHGRKKSVPDTLTLLAPRRSKKSDHHWRMDFGFLAGSDEIIRPHPDSTYYSVPLTIPVLKRLQGIPDDWVTVGSYDEQVEQVCRTMPPVISRLLAHNIHGAISGEIVDLNVAAGMSIKSNRLLGPFKFSSLENSSDPHAFRSRAWRKYLAGDDESQAVCVPP